MDWHSHAFASRGTELGRMHPLEPAPPVLTPFLKWAGGKRWFVHQHQSVFPKSYRRYIEPFLGGGSVFFHLQPRKAILGDINPELIDAYRAIKDRWPGLKRSLGYHQRAHDVLDDYYYDVRAKSPRTLVQRASRLIYLNRTCFNGIYRVNQRGEFNVPRGTKDAVLMPTDDFKALAGQLRRAELRVADFEQLVDEAAEDDFLFADPPYTVRHNLNGFVKYNEVLFSWADQERLARALRRAAARGVKIVATNANHLSVRNLYRNWDFLLQPVSRFSQISADGASRRKYDELIITSNL
jgi:DNA adenine methylase